MLIGETAVSPSPQRFCPEDPDCQLIVQELRTQLPDIQLIYVFGSRGDGSHTSSSDWDIAFLWNNKLDNMTRWELAQTLAAKLNQEVDLVDVLTASTVFNMQVVSKGQLLYGDKNTQHLHEAKIYSMYGRLQESRQGILNQFIDGL